MLNSAYMLSQIKATYILFSLILKNLLLAEFKNISLDIIKLLTKKAYKLPEEKDHQQSAPTNTTLPSAINQYNNLPLSKSVLCLLKLH